MTSPIEHAPGRRLPALWRTILFGSLIGILADAIASGLLVTLLYAYVSVLDRGIMGPITDLSSSLVLAYGLFWLGFSIVGLLPGAIGGALISLTLLLLAGRDLLGRRVGMVVGLVSGTLAGAVLAILLVLWVPPQGHRMMTGGIPQTIMITVSMAGLAGVFHGCLISQWLGHHSA